MIWNRDAAVIGAGGHAKVVISTLQATGYHIWGAFDDDPDKWGKRILGVPIIGAIREAAERPSQYAVIAVGNNRVRKQLAEVLSGFRWVSVVHPSAQVHETVEIGQGSVVCAGAVVQPDSVVGSHCIINTSATVDHDCVLGDFVHLAPGVHLAGGVVLGEGSFLGIGSGVIPGVRIGPWTQVGAGASVVGDLPPGVKALGLPARAVGTT